MRRASYWQRVGRQLGATPVLVPPRRVWSGAAETRRVASEVEAVPVAASVASTVMTSARHVTATPMPIPTPMQRSIAAPRSETIAASFGVRPLSNATAEATATEHETNAVQPIEIATAPSLSKTPAAAVAAAERDHETKAAAAAAALHTETFFSAAHADEAALAPINSTSPTQVTPATVKQTSERTEHDVSVRIGAIEVHVDPPPPPPRPAAPPARPARLARGFASPFGLGQE